MPRVYSVNASSALRARPPETSHSELPRTTMSIVSAKMGDEIPPMPPHWIFDGERESPNYTGSTMQKVVLVTHRAFCAVTIGSSNLRPLWERCNDGGWEEGRSSLRERIQHTNIVVRSFGFNTGRSFLDFYRLVCFLPRSRPSAAPTHRRILDGFRTRRRALRLSSSCPLDFPSQVSSSDPQLCC